MSKLGDCPATPVSLSVFPDGIEESVFYGEKVQCQFIWEGSCPQGYYCPPGYNLAMLSDTSIKSVLDNGGCTYGPDALAVTNASSIPVVCPCTPGFYCPTNTSDPLRCIAGYYCPTNPDIMEDAFGQEIGKQGWGTWGTLSYNCPEGKWCGSGQVVPFTCGPGNHCPENSTSQGNTVAWVFLAIFMGLIVAAFTFVRWSEKNKKQHDKLAVETIKDDNSRVTPELTELPAASASIIEGFEIEFKDIGLTLKDGTTIMKGVNGKFSTGKLCAIMGPSGAGKTTIINLITGKVPRTSGKILVNGEEKDGLTEFTKLTGFVPQEDTMIRMLTVRENIRFSAEYRLDASQTSDDLDAATNQALVDLGIEHVQHTIIGDEIMRGVSGGQRKRVNVAIELVAQPKILFLDEPTSGLDSTTATALCQTLKNIAAQKAITIAAVIHQPSMSSFLQFDDLMLLGKGGQVVYHGPLHDAPAYFALIGFPVPPNCNPSDFYMDVISDEVKRDKFTDFKRTDLFPLWDQYRTTCAIDKNVVSPLEIEKMGSKESSSSPSGMLSNLSNRLQQWFPAVYYSWADYLTEIGRLLTGFFSCKADKYRNTPGFFTQFKIVFIRGIKQNFRGFVPWLAECMVHFVLGIVLGFAGTGIWVMGLPAAYCQTLESQLISSCEQPPAAYADFATKGLFMAFGITFAGVSMGAGAFSGEIANYWREASSGMNTLAYFYAKIFADLPKVFSASFFFWAAFSSSFAVTGSSGDLFGVVIMMYWFGYNLGYFTAQIASGNMIPIVGVMFALIFCAVYAGGGSPTLGEMKRAGDSVWAFNLSGPRWSIESFYLNSVLYYDELPADSGYEGEPYANLNPQLEFIGYNRDNFNKDMWASVLVGFFWSFWGFIVMVTNNLDKKK